MCRFFQFADLLDWYCRLSKEAREVIDIGRTPVKSVSKNLIEKHAREPQPQLNPEKEKKRIARKKERRATLILGEF